MLSAKANEAGVRREGARCLPRRPEGGEEEGNVARPAKARGLAKWSGVDSKNAYMAHAIHMGTDLGVRVRQRRVLFD